MLKEECPILPFVRLVAAVCSAVESCTLKPAQRGSAGVDISKDLKNRGEPADKTQTWAGNGSSFVKPIKYPVISLLPSYSKLFLLTTAC